MENSEVSELKKQSSNSNQSELETPKQLARRVNLPISNIRYLIKAKKLRVVYTTPGKRNPKIPSGSWEEYITNERKA